jgi:oligoribonuclease
MLIWTDIETTGLDPDKDHLLEIAVIVTDDLLDEKARFQRVILPDVDEVILAELTNVNPDDDLSVQHAAGVSGFHPIVVQMHAKNGLWKECVAAENDSTDLDMVLENWILSSGAEGAQLAGSSVHFDRSFIRKQLPRSIKKCHYRNLDVSSVTEIARRFYPLAYATMPRPPKDKAHRGMPDILASIEILRHYLRELRQR